MWVLRHEDPHLLLLRLTVTTGITMMRLMRVCRLPADTHQAQEGKGTPMRRWRTMVKTPLLPRERARAGQRSRRPFAIPNVDR